MVTELRILLCICVLAVVSGAQCTLQKTIPLPANLPSSALTLKLDVPNGVKIQTTSGASWSVVLNENSDNIKIQLAYNDTLSLFSGVVTSNNKPNGASTSSSSPLLFCLSFLSCIFLMKANMDIRILLVLGLSFVPFVFSSSLDCANGTIVITYPAGGNVVVNGVPTLGCSAVSGGTSNVQDPALLGVVKYLGTFWFNDPIVVDLDRDTSCTTNCSEIVVCGDSGCMVYKYWSGQFHRICPASGCSNDPLKTVSGRVYAPAVLADLDGNGKYDFCAGTQAKKVYCFEWNSATHAFVTRSGFPVTANAEIRGMAAGDVDNDGLIEVFVTTTNVDVQVFAYKPDGSTLSGWPRYNTNSGTLGDGNPDLGNSAPVARNKMGHYRYASYGLNVAIGNIDNDAYLEIITTYDNHQIQAFKYNGIAYNTANVYKNQQSKYLNQPVTWGQATQRWTNLTIDEVWWQSGENGCGVQDKPSPLAAGDPFAYGAVPCTPGGDQWLQFTQVPPSIMDIDGDGMNEILSLPNSEKGSSVEGSGYVTQNRVLFVLDGAYDGGNDPTATNMTRSGRRHVNFDHEWPPAGKTVTCQSCFYNNSDPSGNCVAPTICTCRQCGYYPPEAVPAIAFGDIHGNSNPEFIFGFDDGTVVAYDESGSEVWHFDFANDLGLNVQQFAIDCSEPTIADLSGDGKAEVIFTTYGYPTNPINATNVMNLYILDSNGNKLKRISLSTPDTVQNDYSYMFNGNGNGAAGAPTIADIDGDGQLEILINLFDSRLLVYTVPGSHTNCILWPTARGGYLRKGQPDFYP